MDWLSRLLDMMPVSGRVELRCRYGAPWRVIYGQGAPGDIPYHVVLSGSAVLENPAEEGPPQYLEAGDILLVPAGAPHILHDGSGARPMPSYQRPGPNVTYSENAGTGDRLDMLCGRIILRPPHDRLLGAYLRASLIVRGSTNPVSPARTAARDRLLGLVALMRAESGAESLGGHAMLNAFSAALFTFALRLASESNEAPTGLLALASHPRLAPALAAMFEAPARTWTLPELAELCHMSRATLARHFQERLGRSANDLLLDIRMTVAANELRKPTVSTGAVAETAGYHSEAAFQRIFKQRIGMTPAQWRRKRSHSET